MTEASDKLDRSAPRESVLLRELKEFWYYFSENRTAVVGLVFLIGVIAMALLADVISPHSPSDQYREFAELPPAWSAEGRIEFLFGTDYAGRDMLSRIIHGARLSLIAGGIVVVVSLFTGIALGLVAGYFRGVIEIVIMRIMDTILSVPGLLMALVLVAILGPGLVIASRVAGAGRLRLMFVAILPNCMAPLIVQATMSFSNAILDVAALGFLGMGAQPPRPEWGTLIAENRDLILSAPWTVTVPGLIILMTVLAINLMGDGLRDALDPKMKRS
jgi:dipeptide transport system permease protein